MTDSNHGLPPGWVKTTLAEIAEWGSGGTPDRSRHEYFGGNVPWIKTGELTEKYVYRAEEHITAAGLLNSSARVFPKGSVGIAMYGATIGKLSIWGIDAATNQACAVAKPNPACINKLFLYYFLLSEKRDLIRAGKGGAQPNISQGLIKEWPVALPPLNEQYRIVAKIEELFSELDSATASLTLARAQLKTYRQTLLKHAFEGKLTADWHKANEPWRDTKLGDEIVFLTSGSRGWADYYADQGEIFIRAQNLKHDRLDLAEIAYVKLPKGNSEGMRTKVQVGDVLVTITGANVTKTGIVSHDLGTAYVSQHVALCRPGASIVPEFLYWYLLSETGGRKQLSDAAYGAGKPGLNLENIRDVTLSLPHDEQIEIVSRITAALSIEENIRNIITTEQARTNALRQSILKKAFSGQLATQDPADEPASALLARLNSAAAPAKRKKSA